MNIYNFSYFLEHKSEDIQSLSEADMDSINEFSCVIQDFLVINLRNNLKQIKPVEDIFCPPYEVSEDELMYFKCNFQYVSFQCIVILKNLNDVYDYDSNSLKDLTGSIVKLKGSKGILDKTAINDVDSCLQKVEKVLEFMKKKGKIYFDNFFSYKNLIVPIHKFYFSIKGLGIDADIGLLQYEYSNGTCCFTGDLKILEVLRHSKNQFILEIFDQNIILTDDLAIKCVGNEFFLTVLGENFHVINTNTSKYPYLIKYKPLCKEMLASFTFLI